MRFFKFKAKARCNDAFETCNYLPCPRAYLRQLASKRSLAISTIISKHFSQNIITEDASSSRCFGSFTMDKWNPCCLLISTICNNHAHGTEIKQVETKPKLFTIASILYFQICVKFKMKLCIWLTRHRCAMAMNILRHSSDDRGALYRSSQCIIYTSRASCKTNSHDLLKDHVAW